MEKSTKSATFVRCGFTLLAIFLGLTGLSLLLYGGIRVYNVDLTNAERDDLAGYPVSTDSDTYVRVGGLAPFLSCDDLVNAASWEATDTSKSYSQYQNVFRRVCLAPKLPAMILLALSSSFLLAALCLGVTSSLISRGRWHQYLFAIVSAMTFALVIGCCIYYIIQTIGTETRLVECDGLEANAIKKITEIQKGLLVTCINGANSVAGSDNRTAYDWLFHLHLFYAGVATSLTSVFILIILTTWASHRSDKHLMKKIATGIPIGYDDETILDERLLQ